MKGLTGLITLHKDLYLYKIYIALISVPKFTKSEQQKPLMKFYKGKQERSKVSDMMMFVFMFCKESISGATKTKLNKSDTLHDMTPFLNEEEEHKYQ